MSDDVVMMGCVCVCVGFPPLHALPAGGPAAELRRLVQRRPPTETTHSAKEPPTHTTLQQHQQVFTLTHTTTHTHLQLQWNRVKLKNTSKYYKTSV